MPPGAFAVVMLVRRKTDKEKFVIKRFHTPMTELNQKVGLLGVANGGGEREKALQ